MEAAGLDQRKLAHRLGMTEGAVSKWFNKDQAPGLDALARMPRALGVSVDWLLGVPSAVGPSPDAVRAAVEAAVTRARAEIRAEILGAFERGEAKPSRRRVR